LPRPGEPGADSEAVLAEAGLGTAEIAALRESGVVG
jgi:crotonobetainyl-CoA:carnitine CoA-transferase CaiB-like acyl-CoA transferase